MKPYIMLLAAASLGMHAQTVKPGSEGDLTRARMLYEAGNYQAALAQLESEVALGDEMAMRTRFMLANTLRALGRYDEAMHTYKTIVDSDGATREASLSRLGIADCLYAMGTYDRALESYKALWLQQYASADAALISYRCGICCYEIGDRENAGRYFTQAVSSTSTRSAANYYLGVLAFDKDDYGKARSYFALTNHNSAPGDRAPYYLALIDFRQQQWSKALSQARQVLRNCPADQRPEMMRVAGESLLRMGQKSEGLDYLRKYLVECKTPLLSALYLVGVADFENGDYKTAVERLRPVTAGDDKKLTQSAYLYIGQALMHEGDRDAALMSFEKATSIADGDPAALEAAYYNYAVAKLEGASIPFKSSAATLEDFLRRYPSGPYSERVAEYLASGYIADKDYEAAVERIDAISNPSDKLLRTKLQALYAMAWNDCLTGDYSKALNNISKAGQYSRLDAATAAEVNLLKARVLARQGKDAEAEKLFRAYLDKAPRNSPNRSVASYGLGYALYDQNKISGARRAFTDALAGLDDNAKADAINRLGDLAQATGDFAAASSYYSRNLNSASSDYASLQMAKMKGYQRDYKGKLADLESFMAKYPSSSLVPEAMLETTQAQISLGRNDDAVATYRRLISAYPSTSQGRRGYLEMAMTLLDMGRRDDAVEAYKSVVSLYPSSEEAAQAATLLKNIYADEGRAAEYIKFIDNVDNAPKIDAAETENLSYRSAMNAYKNNRSTEQIEAFLNQYPESSHRAELLGILLQSAEIRGDEVRALDIAGQIISRYPDSRVAEEAMAVTADNLYHKGSIPEALTMYRQLQDHASDGNMANRARLGVMRSARDMGDYQLAAKEADELLANLTSADGYSVAEAQFTKACALEAEGKVDESITLWQAGAANPSELFGAKSAYRAAEALFESGKQKQALAAAQKFVKSGSKQRYWVARGFILLSDIYKAQGKKYEARQYLEALRDNYPGDETDIKMMIETRLSEITL